MFLLLVHLALFILSCPISAFVQTKSVSPAMLQMFSMSSIIPTLESAAAVASVVAIHEAGHFFAAKVQGMKVQSFNIGYGPKLFAFNMPKAISARQQLRKVHEEVKLVKDNTIFDKTIIETNTEFAIRFIPLGGYVAFPNNIETDEDGNIVREFTDPDLLQNRPPLQRAFVISAGVLANILLTFLISTGVSSTIGVTTPVYDNGIVINTVSDKSAPAFAAGLQVNDIIMEVKQRPLTASETTVEEFVTTVRRSEGTPIILKVKRSPQTGPQQLFTTRVIPAQNSRGKVSIGVGISAVVKEIKVAKAANFIEVSDFCSIFFNPPIVLNKSNRLLYAAHRLFKWERKIPGDFFLLRIPR